MTDGGARANPGPSAIGIFIKDENGHRIASFGKKIGNSTNNIAEYKAVIYALSWIIENKKELSEDVRIDFFLDSNLVYSQIVGVFKIKSSELRSLLFKVREKESEIRAPINYSYIPREKNKEADKEVNLALDSEP